MAAREWFGTTELTNDALPMDAWFDKLGLNHARFGVLRLDAAFCSLALSSVSI